MHQNAFLTEAHGSRTALTSLAVSWLKGISKLTFRPPLACWGSTEEHTRSYHLHEIRQPRKRSFAKKKNVLHVAISYICSRQLLRNSILLERCLVWLKQQTPQPCNGWPPHWTRQPSAMPLSDTLNTSGSSPFLPWLCWNDTSVLFWNVQNSME